MLPKLPISDKALVSNYGIEIGKSAISSIGFVGTLLCLICALVCTSQLDSSTLHAATLEFDIGDASDIEVTDLRPSLEGDDTSSSIYYLPFVWASSMLYSPYPSISAVDFSPTTYLGWSVIADDPTEYQYQVFLDADDPNPTTMIANDLTIPYLDPATFEFGTTYYWRVIAQTPSGAMVPGPVWSFTTMAPVPDVPDVDSTRVVLAGEFQMGCYPGMSAWPCNAFEMPIHTVYLDSYEISKYEITNIQYRTCVESGHCNLPRLMSADGGRDNYFYDGDYNYFPVVYVSWWDAQDYCEWAGMRLPTEAEWEKAARGIDLRSWPWGDEAPTCDLLNYLVEFGDCDRRGKTREVGSYTGNVSPYGVFDMAGNVKEWVHDKWGDWYYQESPYYNPTGPEESYWFVMRSGSYREAWKYRLSTYRHSGHKGDEPLFRAPHQGFRCARSLKTMTENP